MNYKIACDTLGIPYESDLHTFNNYTISQVKKLYYKQSLLHHPDKNQNCPISAEKFRAAHSAYEFILKVKETGLNTENTNYDTNVFTDMLQSFLSEMGIDETIANEFMVLLMNGVVPVFLKNSIGIMSIYSLNHFLHILTEYRSVIHIPDELYCTIETLITDHLATRNHKIVLTPTIDDLMNHNVFILHREDLGTKFFLPMWHQEMHYEANEITLAVKSTMPSSVSTDDSFYIDTNNDIHVNIIREIRTLLGVDDIDIQLGSTDLYIPVNKLQIIKKQIYIISEHGLPRTNKTDIYNISDISDIFITITLV